MAKPQYPNFTVEQGWDALVAQVVAILAAPVPLAEQTSLANMNTNFPPTSFDRCLAAYNIPASGTNWNGGYLPAWGYTQTGQNTVWKPIGFQCADVGAAATASFANVNTYLNALRAALQASGAMAP